eukprot:SAG11_NODE_33076_length_279_cov_0.811111_1_plen_33_part_01
MLISMLMASFSIQFNSTNSDRVHLHVAQVLISI